MATSFEVISTDVAKLMRYLAYKFVELVPASFLYRNRSDGPRLSPTVSPFESLSLFSQFSACCMRKPRVSRIGY